MTADAPLTDDERAQLETWERDGVYACIHSSVTCPTPIECREKFGLFAAVESILLARETALRETIAQEIEDEAAIVSAAKALSMPVSIAARIVRGGGNASV